MLLSKFKLYLDEHLQQTELGNGLNIIDVIADYLRAFHLHVCTELLKGFAGNYDQSRFRYVNCGQTCCIGNGNTNNFFI